MEQDEESLWQEVLAKEAAAERMYDVYKQCKLAATLVRMAYAKQYGAPPHLPSFES